MRNPPKLQIHLYKHPADAEVKAPFKGGKVYLCSKVLVTHLHMVCVEEMMVVLGALSMGY